MRGASIHAGEFTCPEAEVDLRPGGDYRLVMQTRVTFALSASLRGRRS
jgi:uncharacterized protein YndB with AHSA1/START domain